MTPAQSSIASMRHRISSAWAFMRSRLAEAQSLQLSRRLVLGGTALGACVLGGLVLAAFTAGMHLGERSAARAGGGSPAELARAVVDQRAELENLRARLQERVDALSARMGQVNAHVIRLDALGRRLAAMAEIDSREFDFGSEPAVGGPEAEGFAAEIPDLSRLIADLEDRLTLRDAQLGALEDAILQRELHEQIVPDGRPVRRGFMSSPYGVRQDPFTGHSSFHKGVDFAASRGSDVIAVAAGIVTASGYHAGYGGVVEVSHGDGYVTRYAHNEKVVVEVGQTVARGDNLATMGSTGRSTGPHVHFEVLFKGRPVNPLSYIGR
jgi:murein DD-endopeptidase MepM/ murein hydrolase activator NlpD